MTSVPVLRCAPAAAQRGDDPTGTATPVSRWLLVEQPGPWGRDAARQSDLDPEVADGLIARLAASGVRLLLIRRYGRATPGLRRWAYVDSRPGAESSRWGSVLRPAELLDVPLDGSAGSATPEPIYLVCTHGRHDACCAIRGRPVAAALTAVRPEATWECSHVGGDRFAANLILLPHGYYYGHVPADGALAIVEAYENGVVVPELLRGRSVFPGPVQAAQQFARQALNSWGVDALTPTGAPVSDDGTWHVRLAAPNGEVTVTVAAEQTAPARLTCAGSRDVVATTYRLVSLTAAHY